MSARTLINGAADATLSALDRGLLYGDGLFETIRFERGSAPLWARHMQRLQLGCERLHVPQPDALALGREAATVVNDIESAVLRITITRGLGERGYAPPSTPRPTRIVQAWPLSPLSPDVYEHGVQVRRCSTRLATQPALAGIKHLNRLEQVLARAEWHDPDVAEGLLLDIDGRVISATAANLFLVLDGRLCTPSLNHCGVAGVARAEVLAHCSDAMVADFDENDLMRAEECFLTSSVRGVVPVRRVDGRRLAIGAHTRYWQAHWDELGFAFRGGA